MRSLVTQVALIVCTATLPASCGASSGERAVDAGVETGADDAGMLAADPYVQVAVDHDHACARRQSGWVECWGRNDRGQLGDGTRVDRGTPARVRGLDDAVTIATGFARSCAAKVSGELVCWGASGGWPWVDGHIAGADSDRLTPTPHAGAGAVVDVTITDFDHECALDTSGRVTCFDASLSLAPDVAAFESQDIALVEGGVQLALARHGLGCVRRASGDVLCWGAGAIGDGMDTPSERTALVATGAVDVAVDGGAACAVLSSGRVVCWGRGFRGEFLSRDAAVDPVPVEIDGVRDARAIVMRDRSRCALRRDAAPLCWGQPIASPLTVAHYPPEPLPILGSVEALSNAGGARVCTIEVAGVLRCMGLDTWGQLGLGSVGAHAEPAPTIGLDRVVQVASGRLHACARHDDGAVSCWGDQTAWSGRTVWTLLGPSEAVERVEGLPAVDVIAAGGRGTCAIAGSGVWCWGSNALSDPWGDISLRHVDAGTELRSLAMFASFDDFYERRAAVIASDGRAFRLTGDDPWLIPDWYWPDGVREMSVGTPQCARLLDASIDCRGTVGTVGGRLPVGDIVAFDTGDDAGCFVQASGLVFCFGYDRYGVLGLGDVGVRNRWAAPSPVVDLDDALDVTVGWQHACALRRSGRVACWGYSDTGVLGNDEPLVRPWAADVPGVEDAVAVETGIEHACALRTDGTVVCWGSDARGALARGRVIHVPTPTRVVVP